MVILYYEKIYYNNKTTTNSYTKFIKNFWNTTID